MKGKTQHPYRWTTGEFAKRRIRELEERLRMAEVEGQRESQLLHEAESYLQQRKIARMETELNLIERRKQA